MSLSRIPSNISISSDERRVPWQYKWKRPRVAEIVHKSQHDTCPPSHPHHLCNYDSLQDKIPIGTTSARLNRNEIKTILKDYLRSEPPIDRVFSNVAGRGDHGTSAMVGTPGEVDDARIPANHRKVSHSHMKWEDLESESEGDNDGDSSDDNDRREYIVSVTLFSSKSFVKLMQMQMGSKSSDQDESVHGNRKVLIPADSILVEVIGDSYHLDDVNVVKTNNDISVDGLDDELLEKDVCMAGSERDEMNVIMSKLLIWPTSALVATNDSGIDDQEETVEELSSRDKNYQDEKNDYEYDEEREEEEEVKIENKESAEGKDPEQKALAKLNVEKTLQDLNHLWKNIRNSLKLPKRLSEMTEEEKQKYLRRKLKLQIKRAKQRVGVTSASIFRQIPGSDRHVDMDEIMDVLNQMTLGIGVDVDPDLLATRIGYDSDQRTEGHGTTNGSGRGHDADSQELLLSCLCNDGKVHIFSILDLLRPNRNHGEDNENINLVDVMIQKGSSEDVFMKSFESLLLGDSLKKSLENTVLPLSKSIATVDLSVLAIKENDIPAHVKERDNNENENVETLPAGRTESEATASPLLKIQELGKDIGRLGKDIGRGVDEYGPHFDFSLLDANIEPSTIHNKTVNNVPSICSHAFEYIVVSGSGVRKRQWMSGKEDEKVTQNRWTKNSEFRGGFVTLISTKYFTETRTIFLPFPPKTLTPIIWKSMKMIVVLGEEALQCVAIRTDSSSYVVSSSKHRRVRHPTTDAGIGKTPKHQLEFIKKFTPVNITFDGLDEDLASKTFPLSVTCMPAHPAHILLCTMLEGNLFLRNFQMDSLEFSRQHSNVPTLPMQNVCITACHETRRTMHISLAAFTSISTDESERKQVAPLFRERIRSLGGQGWAVISLEIHDKMHLFYSSWDGSTEIGGSYYEKIAVVENPNNDIFSKIINYKYIDVVGERDKIECEQPQQVAVASLRLGVLRESNLVVTMRSNVILDGYTSPYKEVLSWLCHQDDYYTAAIIALSLLNDKIALVDIENSMSSQEESHAIFQYDGVLESIKPIDIHDNDSSTLYKHVKSGRLSSAISYRERMKQKLLTNLSNTAVNCLINGGSTLAHALDNFLGRNNSYDADSACKILVENATQTIRNLGAGDMKHLAPHSYNPMQSEGHALWPVQCLLRVAVARNCMVTALTMLNDNIPDQLRHRAPCSSQGNHYASTMQLSKSIISMIISSAKEAGGILMNLVEPVTNKMYWDSLDNETQLSLSMLHVQGRYPLLREIEVRDWALKLLYIGSGLIETDLDDVENVVPSEWLRELCTGVLGNAGCDLSQTILFTPAISISFSHASSTSDKDSFQERQEEEEDLYDYLAPVPGFGGIDFDLIIPSFLIMEKRKINWLGNEKIPSQIVLNIICDLAGRPSSEEPIFPFDSNPVIKQCVIMNNALAAANLIGGKNGLILKCSYYLTQEFDLSMSQAERFLCKNSIPNNNTPPDNDNMMDSTFVLTESHTSILWLLEKHTLKVKKYGEFYSESRGHIDPVFAARICLRAWLCLLKLYPGSDQFIEHWLEDRLDLNADDAPLNRLPHAAVIRALLWTEELSEEEGSQLDQKPVLAVSLGFSMPFLVKLTQIPCGLLECVPPSIKI